MAVLLAAEKELPERWITEPPERWSIAFLGGLPQAKFDCAELARDTVRKAISEIEKT